MDDSQSGAAPASGIDRKEWHLLGLLGAASFFNRYDEGLLSLLVVQIQADLAIPETQLGVVGSLVRMGSVPAFAVLLLADRFGRRRLLLATILGYTACTAATALAPGFEMLVAFQFLARGFMTAELLLAMVVVVEEFRPHNRGLGVGVLGTLAVLGHGGAMILFGFIDSIPFGWRGLYGVGVLPLLLLGWLRRGLPETRRFRDLAHAGNAGGVKGAWLAPLRRLFQEQRARLGVVALVSFLWSFSNSPVDFFFPKHFQEVLGLRPAQFATMAIMGGVLGLSGQVLAGWLSDRFGRRPGLLFFCVAEPLAAIAMYTVLGPAAMAVYVVWVFASVGNDAVGRTMGQEIFPTSARATAAGVLVVVGALGSVCGLGMESFLFGVLGSHAAAVRCLALSGLLMPVLVWLAYPETSGRVLEEIVRSKTASDGDASSTDSLPVRSRQAFGTEPSASAPGLEPRSSARPLRRSRA